MLYDVIIIGAGPAGISASLYTQRANLRILVLYENESSLEKTPKIENYYGFENPISGKNLYQNGIMQAQNLGVEIKKEEVIKIEMLTDSFNLKTTRSEYKTRAVILATGISKNKPNVIGIDKFDGKGISYCAICDGFFYRNKSVAVLGTGDYARSEINDLLPVVKDITLLTNGHKPPDFRLNAIKINTKEIQEIVGETKVEQITFKDGSHLKVSGIFIAQGVAGSTEFAKKLGALTSHDKIIVNENMETSIPGLFACGDCTGGLLQISKSIHEGTIAGLQAIQFIKLGGKNK